MAINSLIIEGTLTDKPVLRKNGENDLVAVFTITTQHLRSVPSEHDFFDVEVEDRLAETVVKRADIGSAVRIVGRLRQDWLRSREYPVYYARVVIVGDHLELLKKQ